MDQSWSTTYAKVVTILSKLKKSPTCWVHPEAAVPITIHYYNLKGEMFHITETGKEQDTMFVMESTVIWSINISSLDTTGKEEERTMAPAKDL